MSRSCGRSDFAERPQYDRLTLAVWLVAAAATFVSREQATAEWARPIRVDTSSEATRLYLASQNDFDAGRLAAAARNLADLLGLANSDRVDIDGRSVDVEAAVSSWLARLEEQGDPRLRQALSARLGGYGPERLWFDSSATRNVARQIAVLIDAGQAAKASLIAGRYRPFGRAARSTLPSVVVSAIPALATTPDLDLSGAGWTVPLLPRTKRLSRDTLISLRSFGVAPRLAASPVVHDGRVFVRNWDTLECFDEQTGASVWAARFGRSYADARERSPAQMSIPLDDQIAAQLTTSLLGPVSTDGQRVFAVAAGEAASVSLTSASARRSLGIECRQAESGRMIWSHVDDGVPLAAPVVVDGHAWYPVRYRKKLGLARIQLSDGSTLERFAAAELADRGSRQIASLHRAAFLADGPRLLIGFDEGLAACFDVLEREWLWLRPLGLSDDDKQVRELPDDADVTGGPYAMLPRVRRTVPRVVVDQDGITAQIGCPGWTGDLNVRIADGDSVPLEVTDASAISVNDWGVSLAEGSRQCRVTPVPAIGPNVVGPSPFSVGHAGRVFLQTETGLTRLAESDFEPTSTTHGGHVWLTLNCLTRLLESPVGFLARAGAFDKWIDVEPLLIDRGSVAMTLRTSTAVAKYDVDSAQEPVEWGRTPSVEIVKRRRNRFLDAYDAVPIARLADDAPIVAVSLNRMNRRSIRVGINGVPAGEIALPGRDGDDRLHPLITRGWQLDSTVVLQLGRELFGLEIAKKTDAVNERVEADAERVEASWSARIAWPTDGGVRVGPARRGLVPVARYADFETAVGPLLMSEDGRITGSVAVTKNAVAIAREGSFLLLDPISGQLIGQHFGRGPAEVVMVRGDRLFAVDLERELFMPLEAGSAANRLPLPQGAGTTLRVHQTGVWAFDAKAKRLSRTPWDGGSEKSFPMKRPDLVAFSGTSAAVWDTSGKRLLIWSDGGRPSEMTFGDEREIVRVVLIETPDALLVGLSGQVNDPGLVDRLQSLSGSRVLFAGRLFAFDPNSGRKILTPLWQSELKPCALLVQQPADAPIVVGEWNAKYTLPNGSLSSLHVGHVRVWDRRSGELLVDERSNAPQRPVVTINRSKQLVSAQLGEKEARIDFVNP